MKISGIICEYNPLHFGHIRHINYTKQKSDTVICLMSGNFTQRGTPACIDKYDRARHAVLSGADLVLENPTVFATSSAENFAFGAVKILSALKCDYLSFGSECGDVPLLTECANTIIDPPRQVTDSIKIALSKGLSYAAALGASLTNYDSRFSILNKPNNTLAVEYIKQVIQQHSPMIPITIDRDDNYNNSNIIGEFASSTAIREAVDLGENFDFSKYIPSCVQGDLKSGILKEYKEFIHAYVSTISAEYLSDIEGVSEGIENRIISSAPLQTYDDMVAAIKTRRYTLTKIQRILLAAVLGITKDLVSTAKNVAPYVRILAINKDRLDLLTHLSRTKVYTPPNLTSKQQQMYGIDVKASNLYAALSKEKGNRDHSPLQKI